VQMRATKIASSVYYHMKTDLKDLNFQNLNFEELEEIRLKFKRLLNIMISKLL